MKKILVLLSFFAFLFVNNGFSQNTVTEERQKQWKTGEEILENRLQKMKTNLSLSDKQIKKLRADNVEFAQRLETYRSTITDRMEQKAKMQGLYTDIDASFEKHLTKKQYQELTAARERLMKKN